MIKAFFEPTQIEEALRLKRELGDAAVYLAGGTEVNASYAPSPPANLISLAKLELGGMSEEAGVWSLPATSTIQEILDMPGIPKALASACAMIVNRNVRNMATIGGHVAINKSCSDLIPVLLALGSSLEVSMEADGSPRTMPLEDFLEGDRPRALIRQVIVPGASGRRVAIENYTRSANDMSIIGVAVSLEPEGSTVQSPIIAVGGVARHVVRLSKLERALAGAALPSAEEIEKMVGSEVSPMTDQRGSGELKRHLAGVLVARALHRAKGEEASL